MGKACSPLLEMKTVSKRFRGVQALDRLDFAIEAVEIHALIGENGAGKSTLVTVLTGVHQKDGGQLCLNGRPVEIRNPLEPQQ